MTSQKSDSNISQTDLTIYPSTWPCDDTSTFACNKPLLIHVLNRPLRVPPCSHCAFGAFGAVYATRTSHHKQLSCLTLRVSHRVWIEPEEWLNTSELQSKRSNPNARRQMPGGPPGGCPLTSKPRRRRVSHLSQTGYKQGTGLGTCV